MRRHPIIWFHAAVSAILLASALASSFSGAQPRQGIGGISNAPSSVRGTVLNRATREPIARALVFSDDQRYATLTDNRGHFEFKFPASEREPAENPASPSDPDAILASRLRFLHNSRPNVFQARKPGYLQRPPGRNDSSYGRATANQPEIIIYLDPESLIVGNVLLQDMESDRRFRMELYRHDSSEGQEHWVPAGTFRTWADGAFRFSNLAAGSYKLVADEQIDRDPFNLDLGGQFFGYPPTFYPRSSDFSGATVIQLGTGETIQANLSPTRREYYSVKIPLADVPVGQQPMVRIYPLGHPGPGFSLGFNRAEQFIQGFLPDGDYTLEVVTQSQPGSTGIKNLSIHGAALEAPPLSLLPNPSLSVNVREEFNSRQNDADNAPTAFFDGSQQTAQSSPVNVHVILTAIAEFGQNGSAASHQVEDNGQSTLIIENVRPGRYRVTVESGDGFASSVLSGSTDLLREPLVVSMGGSNAPIQVTLRDDGAEVTGEVEDPSKSAPTSNEADESSPERFVHFLPLDGTTGHFRLAVAGPRVPFLQQQLPPGTYRVIAFDSPRPDLAHASQEVLGKLESMGQVIHVVSGQKEKLRLKLITGNDLP